MKNITPQSLLVRLFFNFKLHWRLYFCIIITVSSKFLTELINKEFDGDLVSLLVFIIYSVIIYLFFGGYTQHYKNRDFDN